MLEGLQQLHVTLRRFDRNYICVETLDIREDIVKVGVAEVRVGLEVVGDTGGRQFEGVDRPCQILFPIRPTKRELKERCLVHGNPVEASHLHPHGWRARRLELP
jgi:hypothetical protein